MKITKVVNLFVSVISIFSVSNSLADTKKSEIQKSISSITEDAGGKVKLKSKDGVFIKIDGIDGESSARQRPAFSTGANLARQRPAFSKTVKVEPKRLNKVNKSQLKSKNGTFIKIDGIDGESIQNKLKTVPKK